VSDVVPTGRLAGLLGGRIERDDRWPFLLTALPIAAWTLLLLFAGAQYPSFDEAKYLAIGIHSLQGLGPLTAFGETFLPHSPLYPMVMAAPQHWLGIDGLAWGRLLNLGAGIATIALAARFAWRVDRWAAPLTAAVLGAWLGLFDLTRTARLDVPQAALCLAYLAIALSAVQRGSLRRAILAGLLLGIGFLVKESSLAFAPAPFLIGLALRRPLVPVLRTGGATLLAFALSTSWWFAWYAARTGRIYRLEIPDRSMAPLVLAVLALVAVALGAGVIARSGAGRWLDARFGAISARPTVRLAAGFLLAGGWLAALGLGFSRTAVLAGNSIVDPYQLARYYAAWGDDIGGLVLFGAGGLIGIVALIKGERRFAPLLIALISGFAWSLFVASVGEPPRNYIAELALLVALGAAGWSIAVRRWADLPPPGRALAVLVVGLLAGAYVGIGADRLSPRFGLVGSLGAGAVGGLLGAGVVGLTARGRRLVPAPATILGIGCIALIGWSVATTGYRAAVAHRASAGPIARAQVSAAVTDWLLRTVPAGSTVAFGSVQSHETALGLGDRYRLVHLSQRTAVFDPTAPLGLAYHGRAAREDWVAVDLHPRQNSYLVFTADEVAAFLAAKRPVAIVYVTGIATSTPSMVGFLDHMPGIVHAGHWSFPSGSATMIADVYTVDHATLAVGTGTIWMEAGAVERLVDQLEAEPTGPEIAARLLARAAFWPTSPGDAAALDRLRALAARR